MGASSSQVASKEMREARTATRANAIQQATQLVRTVQEETVRAAEASSSTASSNAVVLFAQTEVPAETIITATKVAIRQLGRDGAQFTKADLVAIVLALEPRLRKIVAGLDAYTCEDLRAKIRTIIFDPRQYTSISTAEVSASPAALPPPPYQDMEKPE